MPRNIGESLTYVKYINANIFCARPDANRWKAAYLLDMCGRYDNLIARESYPTLYRAMRLPTSNFPPRYNIAPTDQVPIVRVDPRDNTRELVMAGRFTHSRPSTKHGVVRRQSA